MHTCMTRLQYNKQKSCQFYKPTAQDEYSSSHHLSTLNEEGIPRTCLTQPRQSFRFRVPVPLEHVFQKKGQHDSDKQAAA